MNTPTTTLEKLLAEKLISHPKIEVDINRRWEEGQEHHPKAKAMAQLIGAIDYLFGNDSLYLKFGGDGDNGEMLTYALDILYELVDAKAITIYEEIS